VYKKADVRQHMAFLTAASGGNDPFRLMLRNPWSSTWEAAKTIKKQIC